MHFLFLFSYMVFANSNADVSKAESVKNEMIKIDAGYFVMGCNDIYEHNLSQEHLVYTDSFYIDKYEVTNGDFEKLYPQHKEKRHPTSACDQCPVTKLSWFEARQYCQQLGKDLPTEAQWEKAADEISRCSYSFRDKLFSNKEEAKNSGLVRGGFELDDGATPVGSYPANRYGLHDMSGNVWEWTRDWMSVQNSTQELINPTGPEKGHFKVRRGGAWSDDIRGLMTSWRDWSDPHAAFFVDVGFRCSNTKSTSTLGIK